MVLTLNTFDWGIGMSHFWRSRKAGSVPLRAVRKYNEVHLPGGSSEGGQFGSKEAAGAAALADAHKDPSIRNPVVDTSRSRPSIYAEAVNSVRAADQLAHGLEKPPLDQMIAEAMSPDEYRELVQMDNRVQELVHVDGDSEYQHAEYDVTADGKRVNVVYDDEQNALHDRLESEDLRKAEGARAAPGEQPVFTILAGRGGSGKGNFSDERLTPMTSYEREHNLVVNSDHGKERLIEEDGKYLRADGKADMQYAALYHEEATYVAKRTLEDARLLRYNVVYDATMGSDQTKLINDFKAAGYRIRALMVTGPIQASLTNAVQRWVGKPGGPRGRLVPPSVIYNSTSNEANFDKIAHLADEVHLWEVRSNKNVATYIKHY